MNVNDAAKALGQDPQTIRAGLRMGVFPFGVAFKQPGHRNWTYTIFPKKLAEYAEIYNEELKEAENME